MEICALLSNEHVFVSRLAIKSQCINAHTRFFRYQSSAVWKTTSTTSLWGHCNEFTSPPVVRDDYRQSSLDRHFGTSRRQLCGISVTCMHCSLCKPLLCHKLTSLRRKTSGPRSQLARFSSCSNFWSTHNNHIRCQTKQLLLAL